MQKQTTFPIPQQYSQRSSQHEETTKTLSINEMGQRAGKLIYNAIFWAGIIAIPLGLFLIFHLS
jgi:hypothetical protein